MKDWKLVLVAAFLVGSAGLMACEEEAEQGEAEAETAEDIEAQLGLDDLEEGEAEEEEAPAAEAPSEPVIGELAPDFTLVDEQGESHTLSDYRGQTVVLEWFNIPCPFVVRHYEEQTFGNLIEEFEDDHDLVWLAIDTTWDNTPEDTLAWKEETADIRAHDYPVLQDPSGEVGRLYDARTTPHMFVIDEEGILQYMGGIDDDRRGREDVEDRQRYVHMALSAMAAGEEVDPSEAEPYGCTVKYEEEG